ncbi:depupylase/deamidase Dop [Gleimia hominis]|uniref:Depupylase/deamidase Dop n=1 Tax=Gleimia hominis TaxID=595468 RepID=A0ABU3IB41_9ACTO|nr:depupylase/deamidase Dop [Gleimia hominis]MDT3767588.1 depupylase/deamidase Dop [Gleimia hominis]
MSDRVVGTETEFGIMGQTGAQNPIQLSAVAVESFAQSVQTTQVVRWDYAGEDPLNDARGYRIERASADPSMLTDDPYHLAPSGGVEYEPRPSEYEQHMQKATSVVLSNGARFYVDHAHPEYSAPETTNALDAVLYDRAGDRIAQLAMDTARQAGRPITLYKNNTDGKGASYGTHENYQVPRYVDFDDMVAVLIPFFVTRPVVCGAGRVGLGMHSSEAGFQISQRADFVENTVGLQTTFDRPIINTRDEPHAKPSEYRRLHVINGDANQFDVSNLVKIGSTALILRVIERGVGLDLDALSLDEDPVNACWKVSHDTDLQVGLETKSGKTMTALALQRHYFDHACDLDDLTDADKLVLRYWDQVLTGLETDRSSVAHLVEWVGKHLLLDRARTRLRSDWSHPQLAAMDIQWADLREGKSLVEKLDQAGRVKRLFTPSQVQRATTVPPANTRARLRGDAIAHLPTVARASWTSVLVDDGQQLVRLPLPNPNDAGSDAAIRALQAGDAKEFIKLMS